MIQILLGNCLEFETELFAERDLYLMLEELLESVEISLHFFLVLGGSHIFLLANINNPGDVLKTKILFERD